MEVSNELKQLYKLLKDIKSSNDSDYHYLKFIVQKCYKDEMYLLLKQLEEMNEYFDLKWDYE